MRSWIKETENFFFLLLSWPLETMRKSFKSDFCWVSFFVTSELAVGMALCPGLWEATVPSPKPGGQAVSGKWPGAGLTASSFPAAVVGVWRVSHLPVSLADTWGRLSLPGSSVRRPEASPPLACPTAETPEEVAAVIYPPAA